MATTARLPDELKREADAYAARLGISLNALLAVALRDYLDARRSQHPRQPAPPAPVPRLEEAIHSLPSSLARLVERAPARAVRVVDKPKPAEQAAPAGKLTRQQRRHLERQAGKQQPS